MESFKLEDTTESAREAIREQIILPILKDHPGRIAEVVRLSPMETAIRTYDTEDSYRRALLGSDCEVDLDSGEKAASGIWLFGPERAENPAAIYRRLSESLGDGSTVIIASEVPWPGKTLCGDETAEYTAEETAASFIRAGFCDIDQLVEGPFFRIWKATKSANSAYLSLLRAEDFLSESDFLSAERELGEIVEQLDSAVAVRELALLVAACHDLAGRQTACMDALSEALLLDPRCARAMCGLGRIAALCGDLESARDFFDAALRCEPALVAALHGKAVVLEAVGDLNGAFTSMMTASDLRPKNDLLLSETSRIGNQCGKLDEVARFIAYRFAGPETVVARTFPQEGDAPFTVRN
jgi:tetratricopeptide (TPR) repeat protein